MSAERSPEARASRSRAAAAAWLVTGALAAPLAARPAGPIAPPVRSDAQAPAQAGPAAPRQPGGAPAADPAGRAAEAVSVQFELNDALVKDRALPGVLVRVARPGGGDVASGHTGPDGRFGASLPPGTYSVSYSLGGYVPYTSEATELRGEGQLVTVSLSPMLEATGEIARDVRVILNWGSREDQVRDADAHLACACGDESRHVFFRSRRHERAGHVAELDVDDTDWGGPETITLENPPAGSYLYWVHDYSGPPALLGASDLVVRVLIGSEQAGEFRVFRGLTRRAWRPFKAIEVQSDGAPVLVRFTEDEIAEGRDLEVPAELQPPDAAAVAISPLQLFACPGTVLVIGIAILLARRRRRRRP
jgi:hypothetical protein